MALWAIMAAPLLMSNDLRSICRHSKELLQNRHIIAISQDELGKQGYRTAKVQPFYTSHIMEYYIIFKLCVPQVDHFEVWERPLSQGWLAIAVLNTLEIGGPRRFSFQVSPGWKMCTPLCNITQILPKYEEVGVQIGHQASVNPSGTALLVITPISIKQHEQRFLKMQWSEKQMHL